jgi:hypothetical protein
MARFKIKDLLINVESEEPTARRKQQVLVECPPSFTFCLGCTGSVTNCGCTLACTLNLTDICPSPSQCPQAISTLSPRSHVRPADLAVLIADLKQQLAELESQQQALEDSFQPQSVEEVDMLEKKLTAALEDLKARKSELQKKPKK